MSSMPTLTDHAEEHRVSRASFEALRDAQRDGSRYELLAGEVLVTPSPSFLHQYAAGELFALLKARLSGDLVLLSAPFDVHLGTVDGADTTLQPDLLIAPRTAFTEAALPVAPVLVVEILSPSTWRRDLGAKRDAYAGAGVPHSGSWHQRRHPSPSISWAMTTPTARWHTSPVSKPGRSLPLRRSPSVRPTWCARRRTGCPGATLVVAPAVPGPRSSSHRLSRGHARSDRPLPQPEGMRTSFPPGC